jgi:hypothetical protein
MVDVCIALYLNALDTIIVQFEHVQMYMMAYSMSLIYEQVRLSELNQATSVCCIRSATYHTRPCMSSGLCLTFDSLITLNHDL